VALNEEVPFEVFDLSPQDKNAFASSFEIEIDYLKRGQSAVQAFDTDHLARVFKTNFLNQILAIGQVLPTPQFQLQSHSNPCSRW
jgi:hypothetical protein